jgi:hypothetical protein
MRRDPSLSLPVARGRGRTDRRTGTPHLYIQNYPEQESDHLDDEVIGRMNPETGQVESLEILFFSRRLLNDGGVCELPVTARTTLSAAATA